MDNHPGHNAVPSGGGILRNSMGNNNSAPVSPSDEKARPDYQDPPAVNIQEPDPASLAAPGTGRQGNNRLSQTSTRLSTQSGASSTHRHHHHPHQQHVQQPPAWSLSGNHPHYPGGYYGQPGGYPYESAATRRRKAEPLYGLGRPLPTLEEVRALKKMKAFQKAQGRNHSSGSIPTRSSLHHHHHHQQPYSLTPPLQSGSGGGLMPPQRHRTASSSHPDLLFPASGGSGSRTPTADPWMAGATAGAVPGASHPGAQYIVDTPDMLRALVAEAAVLHLTGNEDAAVEPVYRTGSIRDDEPKQANGLTQKAQADIGGKRNGGSIHDSDSSSCSSSDSEDDEEDHPNPWARIRHHIREPAAEFLGTCILILFGTGVNNQVTLSAIPEVATSQKGQYLSISFGWGIGVLLGVYVAGGISGGHINPAVTLSLAGFRGFPWKKVIPYWIAQCLGAFTGAVLTQSIYTEALNLYEGGRGIRTVLNKTSTAALFYTAPLDYMSDVNCYFSEFLNTAILLIVVLAIGDRNNSPPPDGLNPLILLWTVVGLGACLGMQTAYAVNPARDFGPRLMAACFGYGSDVWNFRRQYWLWTPWIATCSGGLFGCFVYDLLIYTGSESPLNKRWGRGRRPKYDEEAKPKLPAGEAGQK